MAKSGEERIAETRKYLGFLDDAIRKRLAGGRKMTRRERARMALIRKFGGGPYDVRKLRTLREKQASLLSLHTAQRRKARELEQRRRETERVEFLGPKRWGRKGAQQTHSQSEVYVSFGRGCGK